jgi:hypothetical protein
MDDTQHPITSGMHSAVERELRMVENAIAVVAAGGAPRVTVAGLSLAEAILPVARTLAEDAGVRLVPLWHPDDAGLDITIERPDA